MFLVWCMMGILTSVILQIGQVQVMGGVPEGLLFAGDQQEVHSLVVEELPGAPVWEGFGHDGQIFYAIALDIRGEWVPETLASAPYRYRRILYPALASGLGAFGGETLLWGMIILATLPTGLAAGSLAVLASRESWSGWAPVFVVLNPALWLSARLLTADNLAFALALLGILAFRRSRDRWAILALAAAALAKEPYLAVSLGLAGYAWSGGQRTRAIRVLAGILLPMTLWWIYIALAVGNPLDSAGNVVAPFTGIADAMFVWPSLRPRDLLYLSAALVGLVTSFLTMLKGPRLLAWLVTPWLIVAVVSSDLVWNIGNNAIRAFAPLFTLGLTGLLSAPGIGVRRASSSTPASP